MKAASKRVLSVPQIAKLCGYTRQGIWNKANAEEIPGLANPGRAHRRYFDTPDLRRWCKSMREEKKQTEEWRIAISALYKPNIFGQGHLPKFLNAYRKYCIGNPIKSWDLDTLEQFIDRLSHVEDVIRELKEEEERKKIIQRERSRLAGLRGVSD